MLVAPLGGNEEGKMISRDLDRERVSTRFCKVWEESGVPSAWVLHAGKPVRTLYVAANEMYLQSSVFNFS